MKRELIILAAGALLIACATHSQKHARSYSHSKPTSNQPVLSVPLPAPSVAPTPRFEYQPVPEFP